MAVVIRFEQAHVFEAEVALVEGQVYQVIALLEPVAGRPSAPALIRALLADVFEASDAAAAKLSLAELRALL